MDKLLNKLLIVYTQKELAAILGISPRTIRRWKKGIPKTTPKKTTLSVLAAFKDAGINRKRNKESIKKSITIENIPVVKGEKLVYRRYIDSGVKFSDLLPVQEYIKDFINSAFPQFADVRYVYFVALIKETYIYEDLDGNEIYMSGYKHISSKSYIITDLESAFFDLSEKLQKAEESGLYHPSLDESIYTDEPIDFYFEVIWIELHIGKDLDK